MKLARFTNTLTFDLLILVGIIFAAIAVAAYATTGGVIA